MRILISFVFLISVTFGLQAQGGASLKKSVIDEGLIDLSIILSGAIAAGSIDEDSRMYFIDFENYLYNIKDIVITNVTGEVVFSKDTRKLPVDSIVDFDFNHLPKGYYTVSIDSYIGKARYVINI